MSFVTLALVLLPFLSVALHESGTRNALSGPLLNKSAFAPLLILKITQLQDKILYYTYDIIGIGNRRQLAKYIIIQHSFPNSPVFANSKSYLEYPILL